MGGKAFDVLLVEDDPCHAELATFALGDQQVDSTVHPVSDGQAAVDYLFRRGDYADPARSPRPSLIILDLRMPKLNGLDVLKEIKSDADLQRIPVVVLTSSTAESDIAAAYRNGANSYLVKPLDFKALCRMMGELCSYWLTWNRPCPVPAPHGHHLPSPVHDRPVPPAAIGDRPCY